MLNDQRTKPQPGYGYNEVILSASRWDADLPWTIEAMFAHVDATFAMNKEIRRIHRAFTAQFGLNEEQSPPLLLFDPGNQCGPFTNLPDDA